MNLDSLSLDELNELLRKTESARNTNNNVQNVSTPNQRSKTRSFLEGALDTATLGFAPKAIAAVGAPILQALRPDLFGDQSYEDVYKNFRDYSRNEMQQSQEANPISYGLGGVLGGAALPFPTNTVKGAAGLGAAYGAASGLGSNDKGEAFTLGRSDAFSALGGGLMGGALGGVTQGIANKFFPTKIQDSNQLKKRVIVPEAAAKKTEATQPDIDILNYIKPGDQTPNERLRISEKFNIPLTKGEALNRTKDLLTEEDAIRGRLGAANQDKIRQFNEERIKDYHKTAEELISKFSGNRKFTEKGANVEGAVNKLVDKALKEREEYSKIYDEAKKHVGAVNGESINFFIENITKDLNESTITKNNVKTAFNELEALKTHVKRKVVDGVPTDDFENINLNSLEAWRQGLNRAYRGALKSGDEQTEFALDSIRNKFDGFIGGVIENGINANDTGMLEKFKKARGLAAEWFGKYTSDNPQEYGKKFAQDMINNRKHSDTPYANEHIINKIFGGSMLGFKVESAAIVKELKKLLPGDAFNDIKIEAAQRLIQPLLKPTPNIITYKNNLNKFIRDNPTLSKELFTKDQLKDLIDLGELGRFAFTREKSAMNPSGTGDVILNKLGLDRYNKFLKNVFTNVELNQNKIAQEVTKETKQNSLANTKLNPAAKGALLSNVQPSNQPQKTSEPVQQNQAMQPEQTVSGLDNLSVAELESLLKTLESNSANDNTDILDRIAKVESGNNPNAKNPNSSASGLFQITDGTWRDLKTKYNLSGNKNDPENQRMAAEYLLQENKAALENVIDREPTDGELYMAHFLGAPQAAKLIQNKNSSEIAARVFPKAAKSNKNIFFANGKPLTLKQVYQKLDNLI